MFFDSINIAFSLVESPDFKDLLRFIRPGIVSASGMPGRFRLRTTLLDDLYAEVKTRVKTFANQFLACSGKMTLALGGRENTRQEHVVNFSSCFWESNCLS